MHQVLCDRSFPHPGKFLHVRNPGPVSWNVDTRPVRPGFFGIAPFVNVPREPLRPLFPPPPVFAYPDVNVRNLKHLDGLDAIYLEQEFSGMPYLKGIKRGKKLSGTPKKRNQHLRKRNPISRAALVENKLIKKEVSQGVQVNTSLNDPFQEDVGETQGELHSRFSSESVELDSRALKKEDEYLNDDIEEGEIVPDSPKQCCSLDVQETLHKLGGQLVPGTTENGSSDNRRMEECIVRTKLCSQKQLLDAIGSGEMMSRNIENPSDEKVSTVMGKASRDCEAGDECVKNAMDHENVLSIVDKVDERSVDAMKKLPSLSFESLETSNAVETTRLCENATEVDISTGPASLSPHEASEGLAFDKGTSRLKRRDPRRVLKTICSLDSNDVQEISSSLPEKRQRPLVSLSESPSKRKCIKKQGEIQSMLDSLVNNDGLEPIAMDIDSLEPIAPISNATKSLDIMHGDEGLGNAHSNLSASELLSVNDSAHHQLRSCDPCKASVDEGCEGGLPLMQDNLGLIKASEIMKGESWNKEQEHFNFSVFRDDKDSWEGIHFELLTDLDRKVLQAERARRIAEQDHMLNSRKLCLVLDLDHTLLNSAKFSEVDDKLKPILCEMENRSGHRAHGQLMKKDLYWYPQLGLWTKLRPGVWDFLSRASELYELHVYTMGNKAYATEMTKLLDPAGTLFAGRVVSRGDDIERTINNDPLPKSKDLDGVLGLESAVIIIDDSINVWPHHQHNLLVVERYLYFPSSRKQFGLSGPSLLERRHDERVADGMLASVLKVIEEIHDNFFSKEQLHEVDVRETLMTVKQSILAGCKILFSRVYPQGESQPHLHPLWQTAEQFGAVCTTTADSDVTHVVAISRGTDKVKWAMHTGRFCVCPAWLEASAVLYRRVSELEFPVPP